MSTLLNIAAISRRTGVAPDTLRKWEQRYGVLRPERTKGGQRRYTEQDTARVEWLRDRVTEGWRIGEAARVLQEAQAPPLEEPDALRQALVEAACDGRAVCVPGLLDQVFAVLPLEHALTEVVAPALRELGDAWCRGEVSVAEEHAVSTQVRARLDQLIADARGGVRGTAVLACAPGEHHELGLLMLAVLLRADGWRVSYLGQNAPVEDTLAFADGLHAALVCFSAARPETLAELRAGLVAAGRRPGPVALGGAALTSEAARELGAIYSGQHLGDAVTRLRDLTAA